MKIVSVVGARPNFMKIAPFIRAIDSYNHQQGESIEHLLVHTGQHYDGEMSKAFFTDLGIREADINLGIGSGSHAEQVGNTMIAFESVIREYRPDWVVVVGDVNATCACSISAKKECVKLAHIEAGLRSYDMAMPEEVNRKVTDCLSDLLFTPDRLSSENLRKEGIAEDKIKFVGNIMIDTLEYERPKVEKLDLPDVLARNLVVPRTSDDLLMITNSDFAVVTLHRPSNVDDPHCLTPLIEFITNEVTRDMPVVWPIHPRTRKQLELFGLWAKVSRTQRLFLLRPISYLDMLRLNMDARVVLTDSGGLQEECCVLGTPCLTMRWNTERPITLIEQGGVSVLVGNQVERIRTEYHRALALPRSPARPELWDGCTAERIVREMVSAS